MNRRRLMAGSVRHTDILEERLKNPRFGRRYRKALLEAEVAERLYRLREKSGLTQKEIAERSGMRQHAVSRIETGALNLTLQTIQRLAEAMGFSVSVTFKPSKR